jgi:serine/threonine-protein kinase
MGDVYRARDTRLKRDVAIKVLPEGFAQDPDRLARFQREAEVLATLSHSNIAAVYGLEKDSGITGIIQELVEGESLAEIIARGPVALEDALPIALQIAGALEAAHEKSIVHRDLKPANIKLTADGTVKVLDFGLAKMLETESVSSSLSASPTLSAHPTYTGVILGTAPYMSPEQARGKQVDRRTDIWSFGCVLFEMVTGKLAFEGGETMSDAVASVLKGEPDWNALPTDTPPHIRKLLRRCLQKDVKKRLPHIGIARIEIDEEPADAPSGPVNVIPLPVSKWHRTVPWALTGLALLGMITLFLRPSPTPQPAAPVWVSAELGADVSLFTNQGAAPGDSLALSRDGTMLAFVGVKGTTRQLYVRRLGQLKAVALAGTEGARDPFFSPDGNWIAFFAGGALKKVSITGGATVSLSDVTGVNNDRGGTWSKDDTIIYSAGPNTGLARVSSTGGKPEQLTKRNPLDPTQRWPQSLPNNKGVLYTVRPSPSANFDDAHIVIQPSSSSPPKVVVRGGYFGRYLSSGHLVYIHNGTLFAAPFDLNKLEVIGPSVPVIEGVASNSGSAGANFTVSDNGTLVFFREREPPVTRQSSGCSAMGK